MERLSVRLDDDEFRSLDALGGKNRTENTKLAIKYAKKYKKLVGKDVNNRTDTEYKEKEA